MEDSFTNRLNQAISNFHASIDFSFILSGLNKGDAVNTWVHDNEAYSMDDRYFSLFPLCDFFHYFNDIKDYYDFDYLNQNTDWYRLWTLTDMGSHIDYGSCTCIEYWETNGVTVTVEVNCHDQSGLYFENLKLFSSLDEMYTHYKSKNFLVYRKNKFYSHNDQELLALYERHITARI